MALTNLIDMLRHEQFRKDVNDLSRFGHLTYYAADIKRATGESIRSITNYYKGKTPIGDDFLKRFERAYGRILKRIRESVTDSDLPLASNEPIPLRQTNIELLPVNDAPLQSIAEPGQNFSSDRDQRITETFVKVRSLLEWLEQELINGKGIK